MAFAPSTHTPTLAAYGLFMSTWSVLEICIEVAIAKQLSIGHLEGNIVTASLGYETRASILRSLLARHSPEYDDVIALISQITQDARRNTLAHGHIRVSKDTLTFIKRDARTRLKASALEFTPVSLIEHITVLNNRIQTIQSRLSITDEDLEAFSNIGQALANKERGSGNADT